MNIPAVQVTLAQSRFCVVHTIDGPMRYEDWCVKERARLLRGTFWARVEIEEHAEHRIALWGTPTEASWKSLQPEPSR